MRNQSPVRVGAVLLTFLAVLLIAVVGGSLPTSAVEAIGDLDLQVRLVGANPDGGHGPDLKGTAKIEAIVSVAGATSGIRLTVERADGSPWMVGSHPFDPEPVKWRKLDGGEPLESADGTPSSGARGSLRTTIVVPLKGADVHEIVLRVTGVGSDGRVTSEAMLRAPLGVQEDLPLEQDGVVKIKMMEGRP